MSDSAQQLISSAMQLPESERREVAQAILASLPSESDDGSLTEVREAWSTEIRRRIDDLDSGRVKAIPSAKAWEMIDGEADVPD